MAQTAKRPTAAQRTAAAREVRTRKIMRLTAIPTGAVVALVALYTSYFHIVALCVEHGQSQTAGHLTPVAIDGLMIVASIAMIGDRSAWIPRLAFTVGALLTLGANVASVHQPDAWGYVMAGTPAIALIASAEMVLHLCLPAAKRKAPRKAPQRSANKIQATTATRVPNRAPVAATA
jgi:hypothetical protein